MSTANEDNSCDIKLLLLHVSDEVDDCAHAGIESEEWDIGSGVVVQRDCMILRTILGLGIVGRVTTGEIDKLIHLLLFQDVPSCLGVHLDDGRWTTGLGGRSVVVVCVLGNICERCIPLQLENSIVIADVLVDEEASILIQTHEARLASISDIARHSDFASARILTRSGS